MTPTLDRPATVPSCSRPLSQSGITAGASLADHRRGPAASAGAAAPLPAVSVLVTVWNGERWLREALESVYAQTTGAAWELIVVDDGSTDRSALIVEEFCRQDPGRVRLLRHPGGSNRGISASRNLALGAALAPVIAFLDCDDVFLPHHLDTQLALLEAHPEVAMVYAAAERWTDHARAFDRTAAKRAWWGSNYLPPLVPGNAIAGHQQPGTLLRWMLHDESHAPCMCTVVVRTAAARAVRGFEDEFHGLYDDQVFHAKLSSRFAVFANPDCTARYRQHPASCCAAANGNAALREREGERFRGWLQSALPRV